MSPKKRNDSKTLRADQQILIDQAKVELAARDAARKVEADRQQREQLEEQERKARAQDFKTKAQDLQRQIEDATKQLVADLQIELTRIVQEEATSRAAIEQNRLEREQLEADQQQAQAQIIADEVTLANAMKSDMQETIKTIQQRLAIERAKEAKRVRKVCKH